MDSSHPARSLLNTDLTRRGAIGLGLGSLTALALAACSGGGGGAGGSSKLTYVFYGNASQQKAVKASFAQFIKKYPKIQFEPQGIAAKSWADFANTISTRIAGGAAPDVIDIATEGLNVFRSKKLVVDLNPYIKKNQSAIDDFYNDMDPGYKDLTSTHGNVSGTTYFMPGGFNTVCFYANTEVFQKAGVDLPGSDDWTWDDFEAAAKQIKEKTGAFMLPFGSAQFTDILPWVLSNGGTLFNDDLTKATVTSDAVIEAAQFCKSMVDKGYSPKPGGTFDAATQLAQGKLAMLAGGRWPTIDMVRLNIVDKVQIVKNPKKVKNGTPIGWDTYPILTSSDNKDDAWTFIQYMTTKDAGETFAKAGGTNIPARRSVALSDVFLNGAPKGSELLYKAASYATTVPGPNRGAETQQAIEQAWLRILTGSVTAEAGLKALNTQLSGLL
ncbi:ABC transporter substrate-binding protein [Pseudolysinimonas sp.]|uniref:ABC transporter substrate-binding protein n=1 Tax=Pseudolysinimonas sp. TaxID=2680009 RepID=UPI003F7E321D